jgi:hypothetical protein
VIQKGRPGAWQGLASTLTVPRLQLDYRAFCGLRKLTCVRPVSRRNFRSARQRAPSFPGMARRIDTPFYQKALINDAQARTLLPAPLSDALKRIEGHDEAQKDGIGSTKPV